MLVDALLDANHRSPGTRAVADPVRVLSYRQLTRLAFVLRGVLARETSCPRVGIMLPASSAFPAAFFGVLWSSRIAVPLNFLLSSEELIPIVKDAGLDLIVTIRHFKDLAADLPARALFLEDLPLKRKMAWAMFRHLPSAPPIDPHDTAVILYTSGTTAQPKGVELTHHNLHSNCVDMVCSLDIDPRQKFLNLLPPFHVFGLTVNVLAPILLRAPVRAIPRFSPVAVIKTVAEHKISAMLAIPSMYAALLKAKSAKPDSLRSVSVAICGGEPLSDAVRIGFKERFGVTLLEGYGLTETSPVVSACTPTMNREGTVGKAIRNVELRIVTANGEPASCGDDGEILVRSPGVMKGYFGKPKETRRVIDAEGWFTTGDIGHLDQDGFLTITGRVKEMLIIGGENVFPREIEGVLENHEAVVRAAVIGVPDDLRGEVPVAFVLAKPEVEISEQALRNYAKESLAGFKVPKRVVIRDELPTGPTGKILKRRLRELL